MGGRLVEMLRGADRVAVLTGAGVSAESGVPTFRDAPDALWARYSPQELANPEAFERDPKLVCQWYDWRRQAIARCEPNAGHDALARLERWFERRGGRLTVLTQNVDRFHQQAGSRNVVELHGTLWDWRCASCGREAQEDRVPLPEHPLRCEACGGARRPAVVWFGEALPPDAIHQSREALGSCDLFMAVGTSAVVEPAASFVHLARQNGAAAVEINPERTPISDTVDLAIRSKSGPVLGQAADAVEEES